MRYALATPAAVAQVSWDTPSSDVSMSIRRVGGVTDHDHRSDAVSASHRSRNRNVRFGMLTVSVANHCSSREHVNGRVAAVSSPCFWVWIGWAFYSSSISLSAAGSGEENAAVGSGAVNAASRSMVIR